MASNAISFQGAKLEIGTGTGTAKNITALTQAFRAQVTSNAHGLVVGDRVTFASVGGMTQINTLVGAIVAVATNTFVVDIDSRAFSAYTSGGTATPVTYTQIKDIKSIRFSPAGRTEIDVTNLDSTAKEKRLGLKDNGSVSGDYNVDLTDAGQDAARASEGSDTVKDFRVVLPASAGTASFQGQVKQLTWEGAVDGVQMGNYEITVTGDMTWA